jgi:hypothetical protein
MSFANQPRVMMQHRHRALPLVIALVASVALTALAPPAAASQSVREQRESLLWLLQAHEFRPDRALLDKVGPDVNRVLVHIAEDPNTRSRIRVRAVSALAVYPSTRTSQFLAGLLYEPELMGTPGGTAIRRQALRSLGYAFGGEMVHTIAGLRNDADPQIREAVAHALGDTRSHHALEVLDSWLPLEQELFVRLAVDRSISRLRGGGGSR